MCIFSWVIFLVDNTTVCCRTLHSCHTSPYFSSMILSFLCHSHLGVNPPFEYFSHLVGFSPFPNQNDASLYQWSRITGICGCMQMLMLSRSDCTIVCSVSIRHYGNSVYHAPTTYEKSLAHIQNAWQLTKYFWRNSQRNVAKVSRVLTDTHPKSEKCCTGLEFVNIQAIARMIGVT